MSLSGYGSNKNTQNDHFIITVRINCTSTYLEIVRLLELVSYNNFNNKTMTCIFIYF